MKTIFIIAVGIIIGPLLALWGLNTISEQASLGWYIPHNFWTYIATYAVMVAFK